MAISIVEELGSTGDRDWRRTKVYLAELTTQLESAAYAYQEIADAGPIDIDTLYRRAHAFLIHAACASRILWPAEVGGSKAKVARRVSRGAMLRGVLEVPEEHPLKNRRLRNLHEHIDEELDNLIERIEVDNPVIIKGQNASDSSATSATALILRNYDSRTRIYTMLEQSFDLPELRTAVQNIGERVYRLLAEQFIAEGESPENIPSVFPSPLVISRDP